MTRGAVMFSRLEIRWKKRSMEIHHEDTALQTCVPSFRCLRRGCWTIPRDACHCPIIEYGVQLCASVLLVYTRALRHRKIDYFFMPKMLRFFLSFSGLCSFPSLCCTAALLLTGCGESP